VNSFCLHTAEKRAVIVSMLPAMLALTSPTNLRALPVARAAVALQMPTFSIPDWLSAAAFSVRQPPEQAVQLRNMLTGSAADSADSEQIDTLIDALAALRVPCTSLGAGLWRASYVRGQAPRWEKAARALPFLPRRNVAGQTYDSAGTVENYAELLGPSVHFVAQGVFSAADAAKRCPKDFNVQVTQGGLVVGGTPFFSSAISGPGYLRVLYCDADVRIFESPRDSPDRWEEAGLVVVQVREGCFGDH